MTDNPTDAHKESEPFDRLTRLAEDITQHPLLLENPDVKCIVFLEDDEKAGLKMSGYDDPIDAVAALFIHMKAMFNSVGRDLEFVPVPDSPEGVDGL